MKRVISIILCFAMMFSFCFEYGSVSYAAYSRFNDLTPAQESEIKDVIDLGIMVGDERSRFNPNEFLTKAEAAAILTRMIGDKGNYLLVDSKFKDVSYKHWAAQYINTAASKGLVLGDGKNFYPDKKLTSMELITMCLRVIGAGQYLDEKGVWPYSHLNFVNGEKILEGVSATDFYVTRIWAAKIISQILGAKTWEVNPATGIPEKQDTTVVEKYLGARGYKDVIITEVDASGYRIDGVYQDKYGNYTEELPYTYISRDLYTDDLVPGVIADITVKSGSIIKIDIKTDNENRFINFDSIVDFNTSSDFLKVRIDSKTQKYLLSEDLLIVNAAGETEVGTKNNMSRAKRAISNEIKDYSGLVKTKDHEIDEDKTYYDADGYVIDVDEYLEDDPDYNPYNKWYEYSSNSDFDENEITGTLVLDGDSHVISISLSVFKNIMYVKSISGSKLTGNTSSGSSGLNIASKNRLSSLSLSKKDVIVKDIDGKTLDLGDIEKEDVILISDTSKPTVYILRLDDTVYGYVDDYDSDGWVLFDGDDYYLNKRYCTTAPKRSTTTRRTLYLDQNGRIVAWK